MAVVHKFPSTSWLEATDGTSNRSFSQSPAQAPMAQTSTWHHNEEDQLGQKKGQDKCNSLCLAQRARQNARWNVTHKYILSLHVLHIHFWMDALLPLTLGDHREGAVEENNER